ncbi:hypothetical protein CALVIDRAFT_329708 [Calocera viscosa TUFC12733]|uniref:Uncharacterized protein n=1 Tax=Calocera viscosa (strain TUFC12733) TaxID=1330018 RepID=A0A167HVQ6_CALVF|nr:hypothetical protein CALVIDRAFT_329708 [Calocera viscosa TUFC12733]
MQCGERTGFVPSNAPRAKERWCSGEEARAHRYVARGGCQEAFVGKHSVPHHQLNDHRHRQRERHGTRETPTTRETVDERDREREIQRTKETENERDTDRERHRLGRNVT